VAAPAQQRSPVISFQGHTITEAKPSNRQGGGPSSQSDYIALILMMPIVLYGLERFSVAKADIKSLDFAVS